MKWVKANERTSNDAEDLPLVINLGSINDPIETFSTGHYDKSRNLYKDECMGYYIALDKVQWLDETSSEEPDQVEIWTEIKKILWEGTLHDYISTEGIEQLKSKYTITRK